MKNGAKFRVVKVGLPEEEKKRLAVRLLTLEAEHDEKIDSLETAGIEADNLRIDLLRIALDLLGVPADNTVELAEKHGQEAYDRIDCICRDMFGSRWSDTEKTPKEIEKFVEWVVEVVHEPKLN